MNKTTIEINRSPDHIQGYGFLHGWPKTGEQDVLEALLDWSQQEENRTKRVYRHLVRTAEENTNLTKWHYAHERDKDQAYCAKLFKGKPASVTHLVDHCATVNRMSLCDAVTYLDVYWQ